MPETEENDSVRGDLEKVFAGDITADAPPPSADLGEAPPPAAPVETPQQKIDRERDDAGRFAKTGEGKPRETLTLKVDTTKPAGQTIKADGSVVGPDGKPLVAKEVTTQQPVTVPPPPWFKGAGKVDWNKMPDPVRAELSAFVSNLETERAEVAPLKEMIDTNREFLVNEAGSVGEGFRQMLQMARMSTTVDGAIQLAHHILRAKGIDPRQAFSGQPSQPGSQPQQPALDSLINHTVQQRLQPLLAQFEQRESQQHLQSIEAFASDPAHPYFNDVRPQMSALLKAGHAKDLKDAYDQATWAHPVIRQQLLAAQTEDAAKAKAAEVQKAQAANQASLTGAPINGGVSMVSESDGSIRGDLMSALKSAAGAV